jgi:hypothetical protein
VKSKGPGAGQEFEISRLTRKASNKERGYRGERETTERLTRMREQQGAVPGKTTARLMMINNVAQWWAVVCDKYSGRLPKMRFSECGSVVKP